MLEPQRCHGSVPATPAPGAGVMDLLKRLHDHICGESRSDLRRVVPVFERLLSPREDAGASVQHKLLDVRAKLLACAGDADVVDVVGRMDRVVEHCIGLVEQEKSQPSAEAAAPVEEVVRLLVALAGGEDGNTFVLEDPMRRTNDKSTMLFAAEKKRVGDRILMNGIELVQRSSALFDKAPIPLEETRLFSQNLFSDFGNGISHQHTSLWCPDNIMAPTDDGDFFNMLSFRQPNRFIGIAPGSSPPKQSFGDSTMGLYRHCDRRSLKTGKDVFFYDGTRQVHCGERKQQTDWGEVSGITESSSWGSESSFDASEPWTARTHAWENMGDRTGLSEYYCRPPAREDKKSLHGIAIPVKFACRNHIDEAPLEIHEMDLIEDSLRALCGVESTTFRKDFQSATFCLPEKRILKLPNATISATASVLEEFRKAGTKLLRLELLAIYYSQDPARGGKTLQAMGDALLLYLSTHRAHVETIAQDCMKTAGSADEDDAMLSIARLVSKTRRLRRVLEAIAHTFCCDADLFWPLLQQGEFPRGVALLDHLHHHVSFLRVEDATGYAHELVTWFLIKACSPLLAVLSDLITLGRVKEETDPFDEFKATSWSRNLLEKVFAGGGDGLFGQGISFEATDMLPRFLEGIASLVVHLSQVQALLRSVNAIASTHPLVNMKPLTMLIHGDQAVEHAENWQFIVAGAMDLMNSTQHKESIPGDQRQLSENNAAKEDTQREYTSEQANAKRYSQLQQKSMLDEQVLDRQQRRMQQVRKEAIDELQLEEELKAQADQGASVRGILLNKYSELMAGANDRHDYMKWRRDRALRLPTAKSQLQHLRADEMVKWTGEKEKMITDTSETCDENEAQANLDAPVGSHNAVLTPAEANSCTEMASASFTHEAETRSEEPIPESASTRKPSVKVNQEAESRASTSAEDGTWRASVKVNKDAGRRTSVSADDGTWRASVKVNKEAGRRTSASADDGTWRASVKVNKEAGRRTSASADDGTSRASVKVNKEAGSRSSGDFTDSTDTVTHRTGVRVLNEPGGGGADVYEALYGEPLTWRMEDRLDESTAVGASQDVEMSEDNTVFPIEPSDDVVPSEAALEAGEDEDIVMRGATEGESDLVSIGSDVADKESIDASEESKPTASSAAASRLSLPLVHPFFWGEISAGDSEVLTHILDQTPSAFNDGFTSFASTANCCVEVPVRLVAETLEQVAVSWYRNSLQVVEHLCWLRKLMLMSEGLCMDIFARDFLLGLNSTTRVNWGIGGRLSSALTLAMIEGSVASDAIAQNYYYRTTPTLSQVLDSLTMVPPVPSLLNEIELVYDVKWPLGLVITSQLLGQYQQMHRFLLYVRLTALEMREAWVMLRSIRGRGELPALLEQLCGGVVYKMQAFLRVFNETFATKVLMSAWSELQQSLQQATSLVDLRRYHEDYVGLALRCCFLDTAGAKIHSAFLDTLSTAWSLTGFVRGLERQVTGRTSEITRIRALCEEYDIALRALVTSLQSVTRDADRHTREFSEMMYQQREQRQQASGCQELTPT